MYLKKTHEISNKFRYFRVYLKVTEQGVSYKSTGDYWICVGWDVYAHECQDQRMSSIASGQWDVLTDDEYFLEMI